MGDVSIGDLGQWNSSGFGFKMLQKMGYKLGQVMFFSLPDRS